MEEALFGEETNGAALNAEGSFVVKAPADGIEITFLDGTKKTRKLGKSIVVTMGEENYDIRPGSSDVLLIITEIVDGYFDEVFPLNARLRELAKSQGREAVNEIVNEAKKLTNESQKKELGDKATEIIAEKTVQLYKETHDIDKQIRALSLKTELEIAQIIIFDSKQYRGEWKKERRKPTQGELEAAIPMEKLRNDFFNEEIKNLIHVYAQLNFADIQKKDFQSLRIGI